MKGNTYKAANAAALPQLFKALSVAQTALQRLGQASAYERDDDGYLVPVPPCLTIPECARLVACIAESIQTLVGPTVKKSDSEPATPSYPSVLPWPSSSFPWDNVDTRDVFLLGLDVRDSQPEPGVATPCPVMKLPNETLMRIFSIGFKTPVQRHVDRPSCNPDRPLTPQMHWVVSLARVCKEWKTPALTVAYSFTHIRSRHQMARFVAALDAFPDLVPFVSGMDIKISTRSSSSSSSGYPRNPLWGARASPWLAPTAGEPEDLLLVGSLLSKCPSLVKLDISISRSCYHYRALSNFMERGLQEAICHLPCLAKIHFRQVVDLGELETILLNCTAIEHLRFDNGIDNLDGRDVACERPHACRLKSFYCNIHEPSLLGEQQLCWILQPAVDTLERLEAFFSPSGGMNAAAFGSFSGAAAADLLARFGPNLTKLALSDGTGHGAFMGARAVVLNPTLRNPPHNNSFDFALSHCTRMRDLTLEWAYTGPDFLASLSTMPLEALVLIGSPMTVGGEDLCARIAGNFLPKLKKLSLHAFNPQIQDWKANDVRELRRMCERRSIALDMTGS